MGFASEFKAFAMRGNVIDMAVGIVIGGAFGKIVSSFVADVVMPPIGMATGGVDFKDLKVTLADGTAAVLGADGAVVTAATDAVTINVGSFINTVIDFAIIAFAIFLVVKAMNAAKKKEEAKPAAPPAPSQEVLLAEIRDILQKKA
jgi:large conductance mechanosensitive channel